MNCIEVSSSPCPTIHPPPARPRMAVLPEVPCSRVSSVAKKGSPPHRCAIPLDLSGAILPCFFLAHFTVSDSLARTARQIERQTPTATFPSPHPLSPLGSLCARNSFHRARARLLPLAPIHDDQGRAHNFSKSNGQPAPLVAFTIPASKTIDSTEKTRLVSLRKCKTSTIPKTMKFWCVHTYEMGYYPKRPVSCRGHCPESEAAAAAASGKRERKDLQG